LAEVVAKRVNQIGLTRRQGFPMQRVQADGNTLSSGKLSADRLLKARMAKPKSNHRQSPCSHLMLPWNTGGDLIWGLSVPDRPDIVRLKERLLSIGGKRFQRNDFLAEELSRPMVKRLLASGKMAPGRDAKLRRMELGRCHENASRLSEEGCEHWIGLALSSDGIWRVHSWCSKEGRLIETTMRRTCYFGVIALELSKARRSAKSLL
jgi:hypothetical protein